MVELAAFAAKLNDVTTAIILVSIVWTLIRCPVVGRYYAPDEKEAASQTWPFAFAACISGTAFMFELSFVLAAASSGAKKIYESGDLRLHGLGDAKAMLCVYGVLSLMYSIMACDLGHVVHIDPLAWGGSRPVFTLRYLEWSICVPILMAISGRSLNPEDLPEKDDKKEKLQNDVLQRPKITLAASARCTSAYIWSSWLALVIDDNFMRWFLIIISFVAFAFASIEQIVACINTPKGPTQHLKIYFLVFQMILFGVYGIVYLFACFGVISAASEQFLYSFGDMGAKVLHSTFLVRIRHQEDMTSIEHLRQRATTLASDLSRLIMNANAPIFSVDREGKVKEWNNKIAELTSILADQAVGRPLLDLVVENGKCGKEVDRVLKETLAGRDTPPLELQLVSSVPSSPTNEKRNRKEAIVVVSACPQRSEDGTVLGVFCVGQDLTEVAALKQAEQSQLNFMAVVSHELRSPLHGIIGLCASLVDSEQDGARVKQLVMVKGCATRLLDLVVNIMEMSAMIAEGKAEKNERPLSRDLVDLPKIIEEVVTMVQSSTDKQGKPLVATKVQLRNQMRTMPIIHADAHKCTQVFYNIITNACKFCRKGSITVSSRVDANNVEVDVTDTGVGITPEAMSRIFKPFEQEDNTEERSYEGIGLGLAISREVVLRHGGCIHVKSEVGVGTTFTVQLPLVMKGRDGSQSPYNSQDGASDDERRAPSKPLSVLAEVIDEDEGEIHQEHEHKRPVVLEASKVLCDGSPDSKPARKPIVLSVDDDAVNQEVIMATLGKDYEVHPAMDGKECLDYFETHSKLPDVVLLDVMMPGMNGYDVCMSLRKDLNLSPSMLPIIMVSAKSPVSSSVTKGLGSGANDYAVKPFEKEVLQARVRTAVQIKRLHEIELLNAKHTQLLYSIMPSHIIERLQAGETMISESHSSVTILFSDIVGWTNIAESLSTPQVVMLLNELFSAFDELTEKHTVFKVETIGDAYMCAAGHDGSQDHADRMIQFGLAMVKASQKVRPPAGLRLQIRVGIHTGPAYTGVVGKKVPRYCFFGDTVNVASRMESHGVPGCIHISQSTRSAMTKPKVANSSKIIERGSVDIKGKGPMATHIVVPEGAAQPVLEKGMPKKRGSICTFSSTPEQEENEPQSPDKKPAAATALKNNGNSAVDADLASARAEIKELERTRAAAKKAAAVAEEDVARVQSEVKAAKEAASRAEGLLERERERAQRFEVENRELEDLKSKLSVEVESCRRQFGRAEDGAKHEQAIEGLRSELRAANEQLEQKAAQNRELQRSVLQPFRGMTEPITEPTPSQTFNTMTDAADVMPSPRADPNAAALCAKLRNTSRLLESREVELQHLRLELKLRDQHVQAMKGQLASKTNELQAKHAELEHALLDLRLASRDMPTLFGQGGRGASNEDLVHSLELSLLERDTHDSSTTASAVQSPGQEQYRPYSEPYRAA